MKVEPEESEKKEEVQQKSKKRTVKKVAEEEVKTEETEEPKPEKVKKSRKTKARETQKDDVKTEESGEPKPKRARKSPKAGESAAQKTLRESVGARVLQKAGTSKKMLGFHVSAAGGLEQAIHNARAEGCRSFALFVRNQRTWNHKPMTDEVVENWKKAAEETGFPMDQVVPHGSYLMNAGSPEADKLEKSREAMVDECRRAEQLGIYMYNFHPGSTVGKCERAECMQTIAETINYVAERTEKIVLVLETMAGQGNSIGGTFEELRDIIGMVKDKKRVGVCIDTCHIFAAGGNISESVTIEIRCYSRLRYPHPSHLQQDNVEVRVDNRLELPESPAHQRLERRSRLKLGSSRAHRSGKARQEGVRAADERLATRRDSDDSGDARRQVSGGDDGDVRHGEKKDCAITFTANFNKSIVLQTVLQR